MPISFSNSLRRLVLNAGGSKSSIRRSRQPRGVRADTTGTAKSDQAEVTEAEKIGTDTQLRSGIGSLKEGDLYPLLSRYLWSELDIYSKRIDERRSSNKQGPKGNKWLYPDLVGMEDLTADWHREIKGIVSEYADNKTKLWSFEVKTILNRSKRSGGLFPSGLQLLMG